MEKSKNEILINTYPVDFKPQFSIVMPVHNEADSIEEIVQEVYEKIGKKIDLEIILSEDGSKDNTKEVIENLSKKIPIKAVMHYEKKGYGGGIKEGLNYVTAPYILFSDSDGQHHPEDFWKLKEKFEENGYSKNLIVCGRRMIRADVMHRKIMSRVFQHLCKIAFDLPDIHDLTAGFKMMHVDLAKEITKDCNYMVESFWTEVLIRANHKKVKIIEIPVQHRTRKHGETVVYKKSKIPKIVYSQLDGIIQVKKELTGEPFLISFIKTKYFKQLVTFALVGASGAGIILFLTWLGVELGLHYIPSAAIGIETSILWAFFLNNKITFRYQARNTRLRVRYIKYQIVALSGLGLNLSILYLLTTSGIFYLLSEAIAIAIVFMFNFTMSKYKVWQN